MGDFDPVELYHGKIGFVLRAILQYVFVIICSYIFVRKIGEPTYPFLFIVQAILSFLCGFSMQSRGVMVTEKLRTALSVSSILVGTSSAIFLLMCKHFIGVLLPVFCYMFYCSLGAMTCGLITVLFEK